MALMTAVTKYGTLRGIAGKSPEHTVFKGVPYAKPPVGPLRFAPPQPVEPWKGELLCDRYSPSAIQRRPFEDPEIQEISEDCLYGEHIKKGCRSFSHYVVSSNPHSY